MTEAIAEKLICERCGADVRENTMFCYNCGSSIDTRDLSPANGVVSEVDENTRSALDDLAEKFKIDEEEDGRLAKAAAERRKARVSNRKSVKYTWQPSDDGPNILFLLLTAVIVVIAGIVVLLTAVLK